MMTNFGFIRVAAAIPELKVADCKFNAERIKNLLQKAVGQGVQIVCFPELCITGYTCGDLFLQDILVKEAEKTIAVLLEETENLPVTYIIGAPVYAKGKLYNAALVCSKGQIMGIVPKSHLPNYSEFYEKRWFHPAENHLVAEIIYAQKTTTFGVKLLFGDENSAFAIEICEDLWSPVPPSSYHTPAGAQIIFNLSASNELAGKNDYLQSLIKQQSARCIAGYVYASSGWGESTTDIVFSGNALIFENGSRLAQSTRFLFEEQLSVSEIDIERLNHERVKISSFRENPTSMDYHYIPTPFHESSSPVSLTRSVNPLPFVPPMEKYDESCNEIFSIQIGGLAKRIMHTQVQTVIIGISGGLDSTLALLVCAKAYDKLGIGRDKIVGVTMPGFGTTERTYNNAIKLMQSLGITIREIDITAACMQHFKDIQHDPSVHNITYENTQARERTKILMNISNQMNGLVIGTGDMSELALGWATYNGDHMSMYGVNMGIPKTLVRHLVKWVSETQVDEHSSSILKDVLNTPVSPELLPTVDGKIVQHTEEIVGPYELHDFFLYYTVRFGFSPRKILYLAEFAFKDKFSTGIITKWMEIFFKRFFSQQFKRSCSPDGPKVGSINLSPRGDWRMPSDASAALWISEIKSLNS